MVRPKSRWKEDVQNGVRKMNIANWREATQDGDGWKRATGEVILDNGDTEKQEEEGGIEEEEEEGIEEKEEEKGPTEEEEEEEEGGGATEEE